MKRLFPLLLLMVLLSAVTVQGKSISDGPVTVTQSKGKTTVKWMGKTIHRYRFSGKVKIVPEGKLTRKMLTARKGKVLYVEKIYGQILNRRLDGMTSCVYYISYKSLAGKVHKGNQIITYCVYNPYTKWIDDIDERYDQIRR